MITHENIVKPSMIMAFEFYEFVSASVGPGNPDGRLNRFRAAIGKNHLLDARQDCGHEFSQLDFFAVLSAVGIGLMQLLDYSLSDGGMIIAGNKRPPAQCIIQQFMTIGVVEIRTAGSFEIERNPRNVPTQSAGNAQRQMFASPMVQCF